MTIRRPMLLTALSTLALALAANAQTDPGPRPGPPTAGRPIAGLTPGQLQAFDAGRRSFDEPEDVAGGLGPRFNLDSCQSCHAHPITGGSSPARNPQIPGATRRGARNTIPPFLTPDGPVRVVRFRQTPNGQRDGGVHNLFVITGRDDAPPGCNIEQEDFSNTNNLTFRIPTPIFGAGLIEAIPDAAIRANLAANRDRKQPLGITGRLNTSDNDGTVLRFGWKAQNKSLAIFGGEAYNVEMGVTNEMFPNERESNNACATNGAIEDHPDLDRQRPSELAQFTIFMRLLDAPTPAPANAAINAGRQLFDQVGCALCHTPSLTTGKSAIDALSNKEVNLYSDLAIHNMGGGLADGITQGRANPGDWRTAPLWGLGQRIFFLHDGRTSDLVEAITQHASRGSEATGTVQRFNALTAEQKQSILAFLRSL